MLQCRISFPYWDLTRTAGPEGNPAGGVIFAELCNEAAIDIHEAFKTMFQCPPRSERAWGDLVRVVDELPGRARSRNAAAGLADPGP
jgi:hypothetical protein